MRDYQAYSDHGYQELLEDDSFRRWVRKPAEDAENARFWNDFAIQFPGKAEDVRLAKAWLADLDSEVETYRLTDQEVQDRLAPLRQMAEGRKRKRSIGRRSLAIAAAILLLLSVGYYRYRATLERQDVYAASVSERQEITLSDGSVVTLNANSRLRVPARDWTSGDREVWLDGEAFFRVAKSRGATPQAFRVHTPGGESTVEVLGTEFNLNTRYDRTEVVLQEGSVALYTRREVVTMEPGDRVVYHESTGVLDKQRVSPERHLSWMQGVMQFESETLDDVVKELQAITGTSITIENDALRDIKLSLTVDTTDVEEFLEILQTIEGDRMQIQKRGEGYVIR